MFGVRASESTRNVTYDPANPIRSAAKVIARAAAEHEGFTERARVDFLDALCLLALGHYSPTDLETGERSSNAALACLEGAPMTNHQTHIILDISVPKERANWFSGREHFATVMVKQNGDVLALDRRTGEFTNRHELTASEMLEARKRAAELRW